MANPEMSQPERAGGRWWMSLCGFSEWEDYLTETTTNEHVQDAVVDLMVGFCS